MTNRLNSTDFVGLSIALSGLIPKIKAKRSVSFKTIVPVKKALHLADCNLSKAFLHACLT